MSASTTRRVLGFLLACTILPGSLSAEAAAPRVVRLRNNFIDAVKNRATVVNLPFQFDHVKGSINQIDSGADDGDLHSSGRPGPFVGLPMVAEVVNARLENLDVVKEMKALEGKEPAKLSGVWRLWFEHPPATVLVQSATVPKPTNTNPDHIFEIHPITVVNGHVADESFVPVPGYSAYSATKAFGVYEKLQLSVKRNAVFTTITGTKVGYNYTEFVAKLVGEPLVVADGTLALADILDNQGNSVVAKPRRLVFAADTKAANAFAATNPKKGTVVRLLGIPRVNLDMLADQGSSNPGETIVVKGAYEIIVVGVL